MRGIVKPIDSLRESYLELVQTQEELRPKILNLALLSNPFLKDQHNYRAIHHQLTLYNKCVLDHSISDHYEVTSFERLFTLASDFANLDARKDILVQLEVTWKWWGEQRRKIKQRKDLGVVKYRVDRQVDKLREYRQRMSHSEVIGQKGSLPNEIRYAEIMPYDNKHRTAHKEMDLPLRRLAEYKIKKLHIIETSNELATWQLDRVLYPKPKKF